MKISDHSLRQLNEAYVASLDEAGLRGLSLRLLADLKEARERLNQNSGNTAIAARNWRELCWKASPGS